MYDLLFLEFLEACSYLSGNVICFGLLKPTLLLQHLLQVAILTELHNNVQTSFGIQYFVKFNNVGMLELAQNFDFAIDGSLQVRILLDHLEIHFFDGYLLFRTVFESFIDFTEGALAETGT